MIEQGISMMIYVEGKRSFDGKLLPFRAGVGLLANNLRIPILPMRIDGLFEIKKAGKKFARPGKIQVRIGKCVQFAPETDPAEIAEALHLSIASL